MPLRLLALLCLALVPQVHAQELQAAARGLDVTIEHLDGAVDINGVQFVVSRVVGSATPELAARVIDLWRAEFGNDSVQTIQCCGWQVASTIRHGTSRVIQWRSIAAGHELLWSTTALTAQPRNGLSPTVPLPGNCESGSAVNGRVAERQFIQIAARCREGATTVLNRLTRGLESKGWAWKQVNPNLVQAERGAAQAQLIVVPKPDIAGGRDSERSSLVIVESQPASQVKK